MEIKKIPINVNYHVLNSKIDNLKYFIARGHFPHLLWDRFKWYWFPRLNIIPSFPQTIDIETSLSCQLKCPMCTREIMSSKKLSGIMSFSLFKKIVDECSNHNVFSIKLSWRGEPLMNPKLIDMIKYAKDKGIKDVAFLTNGGLFKNDTPEQLMDAGLDWISFSIDGMNDDYERIRKPIKFEQITNIIKKIHYLKKQRKVKKPLVRIQSISSLVRNTPEYFTFWKPWVDRISCIAEKPLVNPETILHDPNYICQSPFQRLFITYNGDVVSCHGDYFLKNIIGNVNTHSIKEIWTSSKMVNFRNKMRNRQRLDFESCRRCSDGGQYQKDSLILEGRKVSIIKYNHKDVSS